MATGKIIDVNTELNKLYIDCSTDKAVVDVIKQLIFIYDQEADQFAYNAFLKNGLGIKLCNASDNVNGQNGLYIIFKDTEKEIIYLYMDSPIAEYITEPGWYLINGAEFRKVDGINEIISSTPLTSESTVGQQNNLLTSLLSFNETFSI